MPVQASDIKYYLTGGSGNTNVNASIGGARSTATGGSVTSGLIPTGPLNNLWDNITGTNHAAGNTDTSQAHDYRVICIKIDSPLADASSSTLDNAVLQFNSTSLLTGDLIEGYSAATVNHTITAGANENTAPTDGGAITFATITGGGITLPASLAAGDEVHIALKRTIAAASTAQQEDVQFKITGDTI